jgi:hypothetical protein
MIGPPLTKFRSLHFSPGERRMPRSKRASYKPRHYAKWTPEYQARQDRVIRLIHGTNLAQAEEQVSKY